MHEYGYIKYVSGQIFQIIFQYFTNLLGSDICSQES